LKFRRNVVIASRGILAPHLHLQVGFASAALMSAGSVALHPKTSRGFNLSPAIQWQHIIIAARERCTSGTLLELLDAGTLVAVLLLPGLGYSQDGWHGWQASLLIQAFLCFVPVETSLV
jgi:hypothetical protein